MATKVKRDPKKDMSTQEPCGRLERQGKYAGLAHAAWVIAAEQSSALDEIERLLDAGDNDAAIEAMRKYIGPKKPVMGETDATTGRRKAS